MKGGAPLDMAEMERVSSLFDVDKVGGAITGGVSNGEQLVSSSTGMVGSLDDVQGMTVGDRLQTGGGGGRRRGRKTRRGRKRNSRKTRSNRKPRFRLNLRASIRWRQHQ